MTGKGLRGEVAELKPTLPVTNPASVLIQRLLHLDLCVWLPCPESQWHYKEKVQVLVKGFLLRSHFMSQTTSEFGVSCY